MCIFSFSSTFLLFQLSHSLLVHLPPQFTHHFSCPISPTLFQLTTHKHSLTISPVPHVPLSFSSPPTTIHSTFLQSHLSHSLSAHHPPPFTHHFSCPICPTVFQLTTHHHSFTISPVPSLPLSFSSPPTTIHSQFLLSHLPHSLSAHHPPPSLTSTNHAAPHCTILSIPPLLPLTSQQISPSASVLAQHSHI